MTRTTETSGVHPHVAPEVIKAAVIEDEREIRECLALLINGTAGYRCVGTYRTVEAALEAFRVDPPDVVLVDTSGCPGCRASRASGGCANATRTSSP
jgi:DNA-binding NarL/FixJ family response regulator